MYDKISKQMRLDIVSYAVFGAFPDNPALMAVIKNQGVFETLEAFAYDADQCAQVVKFFYNYVPGIAWKNDGAPIAWMNRGGMIGILKEQQGGQTSPNKEMDMIANFNAKFRQATEAPQQVWPLNDGVDVAKPEVAN